MERSFQLFAVILIGIAAFFLWTGSSDAGFILAVLACVSFFIATRFPAKARVEKRNVELLQNQIIQEKESLEENSLGSETRSEELDS